MKVTVIIPTCSSGRIPLLMQTIESIIGGSYKEFEIVIVADGNPYIYETYNKGLCGIKVVLNEKRRDWIFSINRVLREFDSDYYIYASDDLIFPPDCIKHAMVAMERCFPDGYGVISLGRKNRCCFGLFGYKWAEHFPGRQAFCPDYIHYCSDGELLQTVKKLKKFAFPPERESQVEHFRMNDETRRLARKIRARDREIWHKREEKGYLWGIDFNLVTRQ